MAAASHALNTALLQLSHSDRARRALTSLPATRAVVRRFVAGTDDADAIPVLRELHAQGLTSTVDRLGEDVTAREQADATTQGYTDLLALLHEAGLVPAAEVSVKLSAVGAGIDPALGLANAHSICSAAAQAGTTVSLDMEDHTTVDRTLSILTELRQEFPWVAIVLQSALRRTEADLREVSSTGSRVRLVKGAYAEPASVAYSRKADVDASYRRGLEILMAGSGYPQVATHDLDLIAYATELAARFGRKPESFEYQMLYGIRAAEQARLVSAGNRVRIYVPYGTDWYGYFMRRLAERPANLGFFARALVNR